MEAGASRSIPGHWWLLLAPLHSTSAQPHQGSLFCSRPWKWGRLEWGALERRNRRISCSILNPTPPAGSRRQWADHPKWTSCSALGKLGGMWGALLTSAVLQEMQPTTLVSVMLMTNNTSESSVTVPLPHTVELPVHRVKKSNPAGFTV